MDDKKLEELQKELEKQIDQEAEVEKHIIESSKEIACNLMKTDKKRCKAIINDQEYLLSYMPYKTKTNVNMICILSVNIAHYKLSLGNYRPAKIEAEFDNDYSEVENLQRVVESYIRHVSGLIKPEELE